MMGLGGLRGRQRDDHRVPARNEARKSSGLGTREASAGAEGEGDIGYSVWPRLSGLEVEGYQESL